MGASPIPGGKVPFIFALLLSGPMPADLAAQQASDAPSASEPTIVGIVAGWAVNDGIWKPEADTETVGGIVLGAFGQAATPLSWFAVRAEILWSQRGLDVVDGAGAPAGSVRADFLGFALHARAFRALGPVRLHLAAGPTVDQTLQRRVDSALTPALNREVGPTFGVHIGAGLGVTVADRYRVELETRWLEGLSDAHAGDFLSARNRSLEFLTRVGIPLSRR